MAQETKTGGYSVSCEAPRKWFVERNGVRLSSFTFPSRKQADSAMFVALHGESIALGIREANSTL